MKTVVIGGGAAGMMAAVTAARYGSDVTLLERNEKLGKKIYITGKGRCNVTNNCDIDVFLKNIVSNPKFMMSALHAFSPADLMGFLESGGLALKTERGNRVFPASDKASDVTKVFEKLLRKYNVEVVFNCVATSFEAENGVITGVVTNLGKYIADRFVLCSGGVSYPSTGSDGLGLKLAGALGHKIIEPKAALSALIADTPPSLAGLSLKNVRASVTENGRVLCDEFGEMLFTHKGVSGPIILTLSSKIAGMDFSKLRLSVDLKPALGEKELDARVLRDFSAVSNKCFSNSLDNLLPHSLISVILEKSGIALGTKVHQITSAQRKGLVGLLKNLTFNLISAEDISAAIVTKGGVDVKQINPSTMRSKLLSNLYFAGEMIDVDALTGGFNLQCAFSTGFLAGKSCAQDNQ